MLIASKRKILLSQSIYAFLVIAFLIIAIIPITVQFNAILVKNNPSSNEFLSDITQEKIFATGNHGVIFLGNSFIILLSLFLGIITIVYYIPTLSSLGLTKYKGKKEIRITKYRFPKYGYTIPINGIQIRISRKLNSFKGLFLRELDFLIILPHDYKGEKRLFDFLACEKVYYTSKQIVLRKTVDIQNIPLIVVRSQVLISPS